MILTSRALVPIFIFIITVIGFNEKAKKAYSQSELPLPSDFPNLHFIPGKGTSWLAQTPPSLQPTDLSPVTDAERLLLQALEVANSLKDPYDRATLLNDIALKYAKIGIL